MNVKSILALVVIILVELYILSVIYAEPIPNNIKEVLVAEIAVTENVVVVKEVVEVVNILEYKDEDKIFELEDDASEKWAARMKIIDKYDGLILEIAKQEKINPQMLKIIISLESNGVVNSVNHNSNGSKDFGLTQINDKSWGDYFDYERLLVDARYGIECSAKVIKSKMQMLKNLKREVTIANVFHAYNGLSDRGLVYKKKAMDGYGQFKYPINEVIWNLERR